MTIPEITAYVMALPVEELRRLTATEIMGATWPNQYWVPDVDRNQSRQVTDKVREYVARHHFREAEFHSTPGIRPYWCVVTPDQESRAALIAHMIHKEKL